MKEKVFVQLYSIVRQEREGHLEVFRRMSEIGYDGIELLGNNTNGLSYNEYRQLLQDLGLKVLSSHNLHTPEDFDFAAGLGAKYSIIPGCDDVRDLEKLKQICEDWNRQGKELAKYGLKAVIHNHSDEFVWQDEETKEARVYDYILKYTDPEYVGMELDVGWVVRAGADPVEYLTQHAGRFPLIHIKECNAVATTFVEMQHFPKWIIEMEEPKFINGVPYFSDAQKHAMDETRKWNVELGQGLVDFPAIVKAGDAQGCEAYISEREYYHLASVPDGDPLKCAELDYKFMRECL